MTSDKSQIIEKMYKDNANRVFRYFYYQTSDKSLSEDLTSKTFFKVIDKLETFNEKKASSATWIMTIAKNLLIDHFRLSSTRKSVSLQSLEDSVYDNEVSASTVDSIENKSINNDLISNNGNKTNDNYVQLYRNKEILRVNIEKLTEDEQILIFLRFNEELSYEEMAKELKITTNSVGAKLFRTIRKLRNILEKSGDLNKLDNVQ